MTERDEAIVRVMYIQPDAPSVEDVYREYRKHGGEAAFEEVKKSLEDLPPHLLAFRHPVAIANRNLAVLGIVEKKLQECADILAVLFGNEHETVKCFAHLMADILREIKALDLDGKEARHGS